MLAQSEHTTVRDAVVEAKLLTQGEESELWRWPSVRGGAHVGTRGEGAGLVEEAEKWEGALGIPPL